MGGCFLSGQAPCQGLSVLLLPALLHHRDQQHLLSLSIRRYQAKWAEQVPENFRFTLKLNRKITHNKRLKDVEDEMEWFLKGVAALGKKLGTLLVQLPPYFREDSEVLEHFLEGYSQRAPLALEFRHP